METSLGIIGLVFLLLAVLSLTRAVQRLFEQTWELDPLSVRNTANGLLWIGGLALYLAASSFLHTTLGRSQLELSAALLSTPVTVIFMAWSGRVLSANRIGRPDLMPFAILGALLLAAYSVAATVYVPHLFDTFATRYGVIGAVFAMISARGQALAAMTGERREGLSAAFRDAGEANPGHCEVEAAIELAGLAQADCTAGRGDLHVRPAVLSLSVKVRLSVSLSITATLRPRG